MANYESIKKANDEQKRLNKNLEDAERRIGTMYSKYNDFADKRTKEARDYKKALDAQEKALDTIAEKVEDQKENVKKIAEEYKEQLATSSKIKGLEKDITDFAKDQAVQANAIAGFDQTALLTAKAQEAVDAGRIGKANAILEIATLERDLMKEVLDGNLDVEAAQTRQAEIQADLASKYDLSGNEVDAISGLMTDQIANASMLNDELAATNSLGISRRDILKFRDEAFNKYLNNSKKL